MIRRSPMQALRSLIVSALALAVLPAAAQAQNYDGNHQVRFGSFLQAGRIGGDARSSPAPVANGSYGFASLGLGVAAGLEWVDKSSWSYGVEMDVAVLSGNTDSIGAAFAADYIATLRLRAGRHIRPDLFWYGTVGLAGLGSEVKNLRAVVVPGADNAVKAASLQPGFALGTGLEYDFGPGLLFGEYLYASFSDASRVLSGRRFTYDADHHAFRIGLKFKVGHEYRDDVRERLGR